MSLDYFGEEFPSQTIRIQSAEGGQATISPYGAHLLSWVTPDADERIYLSPLAEYRVGAAIRGGVPVIFPQFAGLGPLPKHGFARTQLWEIAQQADDAVSFCLSETVKSQLAWPNRFRLDYTLRLVGPRLEMQLTVTNTDNRPFTFTAALHTYLRVDHLLSANVQGLQGLICRPSAGGDPVLESFGPVRFEGEVDRIYQDIPAPLCLNDGHRKLSINAPGFPDAVIWNPGPEKCAQLGDMLPDGYQQFVCIEAAAITKPITLPPAQTWHAAQTLTPVS